MRGRPLDRRNLLAAALGIVGLMVMSAVAAPVLLPLNSGSHASTQGLQSGRTAPPTNSHPSNPAPPPPVPLPEVPSLPLPALPDGPATPGPSTEAAFPTFGNEVELPLSSNFGEPSIAADASGKLYAAAPGSHSAVWRSLDRGASWARVADSLGSSGDSDVATDALGRVYVSDLFSNVPVSYSSNNATSFTASVPTANGGDNDRQWLAAHGNGHVWSVWRDGSTERLATSHDGGATYTRSVIATNVVYASNILATSDTDLWWAYSSGSGAIRLARSSNGGASWTDTLVKANTGDLKIFPGVAADTANNVYVTWVEGAGTLLSRSTTVKLATSRDGGATFGSPVTIANGSTYNVFPWIVADAPGRVAIAWYQGTPPVAGGTLDPDAALGATWKVRLAFSADANAANPTWAQNDITGIIHRGSICTDGTLCFGQFAPGGPLFPVYNRSFLDFFEMCEMPNGDLALVFNSDGRPPAGVDGAAAITFIHSLVQNGGPNLKA